MKTIPKLNLSTEGIWDRRTHGALVIAGPCSAESEEQVLRTAEAVSKLSHVTIFRAGVWKPRTRPNDFEGVGVAALKWLQEVKARTNLLTAVEVANAKHVQEACKHDVDVLWIGARTTVNPFAVQEIADALRGADIPVLVKNPINPELPLWIGALERLNNANINRLAAVHRGFSTYENTPYRNAPRWDIAIELKRLIPDLPIICDPSHIAGRPELLQHIAQRALDLSMNGLMIETHVHPEAALSDAGQQIRPEELRDLLSRLQFRNTNGSKPELREMLESLRAQSDVIDHELLEILARRMEVVRKIGKFKQKNNMAILQMQRWAELLQDRVTKGCQFGLEEEFIKAVYEVLHQYAIKLQAGVMNEEL